MNFDFTNSFGNATTRPNTESETEHKPLFSRKNKSERQEPNPTLPTPKPTTTSPKTQTPPYQYQPTLPPAATLPDPQIQEPIHKRANRYATQVLGAGFIRFSTIRKAGGGLALFLFGLSLFIAGLVPFTAFFLSLDIYPSWFKAAPFFVGPLCYLLISWFELESHPFEQGISADWTGAIAWFFCVALDWGASYSVIVKWLPGKHVAMPGLVHNFVGNDWFTAFTALLISGIVAFAAEPIMRSGLKKGLNGLYIYPAWLD